MPRFLLAAAKTLAAAGVTIAFAAVIPFANSGTGVAWAASRHMRTPAAAATTGSAESPTSGVCPKALIAQDAYAGARDNADPHGQAAAASRLSGLPFGGASDYNGPPPSAQHTHIKLTAKPDPTVPAAGTPRVSGLPFGGASDYNGPPPAAQHTHSKLTAKRDPTVPAAGTSRLSGLPFGGAGLCA